MTTQHRRRLRREIALGMCAGLFAGTLSAQAQRDCTLERTRGSKRAALSNGVTGTMTWSSCTSIVHDFVFEWPRERGLPGPQEALKRASALLREWRKTTKTGESPFEDVPTAIDKRAAEPQPYAFGEEIVVTDEPGWDGVSVMVKSAGQKTQLTIHYWANP